MGKNKKFKDQRKKLTTLAEQLAKLLEGLQTEVYAKCTDAEFMQLFAILGADSFHNLSILDVVRNFKPKTKRIRVPQHFETIMLQKAYDQWCDSYDRWRDFQNAIINYKPKAKGKHGGLKRFKEEFMVDKKHKVALLKEYVDIKDKETKTGLTDYDIDRFSKLKEKIPLEIRKKTRNRGLKGLALDWMVTEYPCTMETLRQIISRKAI